MKEFYFIYTYYNNNIQFCQYEARKISVIEYTIKEAWKSVIESISRELDKMHLEFNALDKIELITIIEK